MIKIQHYNDGKQKWQSHEVYIKDDFVPTEKSKDLNVWDLDIFNMRGYGESYEEALHDFVQKFDYCVDQILAFQNVLHGVDNGSANIGVIEVNCMGNKI